MTPEDPLAGRTFAALERLESHPGLEMRVVDGVQMPFYQGRRVIERGSPIAGGVSLGATEREAIVVDWEKAPTLEQLYRSVVDTYSWYFTSPTEIPLALQATYDIILNWFNPGDRTPEDGRTALSFILRKLDAKRDGKVNLEHFLVYHAGDCRHQSLAAGAIVERLIAEHYLEGTVTIERNSLNSQGHAWTTHTPPFGRATVIDTVLRYLGPPQRPDVPWLYLHQSDMRHP
ncbi:hypothetical protein HZB01_02785 [Candidatus Woesearchaeota archaeon]|nr:hypothetical protein [Candidatus Woesearchaeota archaeon]